MEDARESYGTWLFDNWIDDFARENFGVGTSFFNMDETSPRCHGKTA